MTGNPLNANLSPETGPGSDSTSEPGKPLHEATQEADGPYLPHSCKCGAKWSGGETAHCAADCHLNFSTARSFDRHRKDGQCRPPADIGLVERERRGYTVWGQPGDERLAAVFATDESETP